MNKIVKLLITLLSAATISFAATCSMNIHFRGSPTPHPTVMPTSEPIVTPTPESTPKPVLTPEPITTPEPIVTPEPTPEPTPEAMWGWPLDGISYISGYFRQQRGMDPPDGHHGIDIVPQHSNQLVMAIRDGCVLAADWYDGYGYRAVLEHADGYRSLYAHLAGFNGISPGMCITKGDAVGVVDNTGFSTGTHLHLEVEKDGALIDPLLVLPPFQSIPYKEGPGEYDLAPDWGIDIPGFSSLPKSFNGFFDPPPPNPEEWKKYRGYSSPPPGYIWPKWIALTHAWQYKPTFLGSNRTIKYCVASPDWSNSAGNELWDISNWVLEVPPSWENVGIDLVGSCAGPWENIQIGIRFADYGPVGWAGYAEPTQWVYNNGWYFNHCNATINTYYTSSLGLKRFSETVLTHEVGHCLGLDHGGSGIMDYSTMWWWRWPAPHDMEEVKNQLR